MRDPVRPVGRLEKIGYGMGDLASSFYLNFFNLYLLFFFVELGGVAPAAIAAERSLRRCDTPRRDERQRAMLPASRRETAVLPQACVCRVLTRRTIATCRGVPAIRRSGGVGRSPSSPIATIRLYTYYSAPVSLPGRKPPLVGTPPGVPVLSPEKLLDSLKL